MVFYQVPLDLSGYMSNIALPLSVRSMNQVRALERTLMKEHDISIKCERVYRHQYGSNVAPNGSDDEDAIHFVRLSAQVYLNLSDFQCVAEAVLVVLDKL